MPDLARSRLDRALPGRYPKNRGHHPPKSNWLIAEASFFRDSRNDPCANQRITSTVLVPAGSGGSQSVISGSICRLIPLSSILTLLFVPGTPTVDRAP